jgi:hypothetical protein
MRLNPNPRLEKLKDFRSAHYLYCFYFTANPHTRQWANNIRERRLRAEWMTHRWDMDRDWPIRFTHRHSALWDLY